MEPTKSDTSPKPKDGKTEENGNRRSRRHGFNRPAAAGSKFTGECDEMKGNVFDCSGVGQADQFTKTQKMLAGLVGRTYKSGGSIRLAVETLKKPTLAVPSDPAANATATETEIWKQSISAYVKEKMLMEENLKKLCILWCGASAQTHLEPSWRQVNPTIPYHQMVMVSVC